MAGSRDALAGRDVLAGRDTLVGREVFEDGPGSKLAAE